MLRLKFATGFVLVPIVLASLYIGGWSAFIVAAVFLVIGLWEFYAALSRRNTKPLVELGLPGGVFLLGAAQWTPESRFAEVAIATIGAVTLLALLFHLPRRRDSSVLTNTAATVFGVVYVALLFSYYLRLRHVSLHYLTGVPEGGFRDRMGVVVLALAAVWTMDTTANIVGKCWGTKRPWPNVSPNKTWEGTLAGLLGAVLATLLWGALCRLPLLHMLSLGLLLGVVAILGDFCGSLLKRDLGLKDWGTVLPGHGGILDRFDSLVFAMPIAYYYVLLLGAGFF
ncbi:MAG: phosphatidate cytidylyltransferase [Candidatus Zipacnadales bacterium]